MGTVDNSLVKVKNNTAANRFDFAHQYFCPIRNLPSMGISLQVNHDYQNLWRFHSDEIPS
jgi:hypothetical protein